MRLPPTIAFFITPHGFGHASRSAALMVALIQHIPRVRFEIFTTCPPWIFEDTLKGPFGYHAVQTDIGMVQLSPLAEDAVETCRRLDRWLPFNLTLLKGLARQVQNMHCSLVMCDVSALGISVAQRAGLPSVLVENFTWDWVYRAYAHTAPGLERHAVYLEEQLSRVTCHIQSQPVCRPVNGAQQVGPIARSPRYNGETIRRQLGLAATDKMVLVSMGGVPDHFNFINHLPDDLEVCLVIPGLMENASSHPRVIGLTTRSDFYHPDLMAAADVLVGKAGYSTLAEAYFAGIPFGYVSRPEFPESTVLEQFLARHMSACPIDAQAYADGSWISALPRLLAMPRTRPVLDNGAEAAAQAVGLLLE